MVGRRSAAGPELARPLLFLAGDKAMPVLPTLLTEARVPFEQLCVYETQPRPNLDALLAEYDAAHGATLRWVVVHSPSTVRATLPTLGRWADRGVRLAAIGPTTAAALAAGGLAASAVAVTPTPTGVAAAIQEVS